MDWIRLAIEIIVGLLLFILGAFAGMLITCLIISKRRDGNK